MRSIAQSRPPARSSVSKLYARADLCIRTLEQSEFKPPACLKRLNDEKTCEQKGEATLSPRNTHISRLFFEDQSRGALLKTPSQVKNSATTTTHFTKTSSLYTDPSSPSYTTYSNHSTTLSCVSMFVRQDRSCLHTGRLFTRRLGRSSKGGGTKAAGVSMRWPPAGTTAIVENVLSVLNIRNPPPLANIMGRAFE